MAAALKPEAAAALAETCQYLTFTLGGEMYAVDTLSVKEIIEYGQVTAVPMMPACIRGVINLRGAVVPVIDLKARFGRPPTEVTRRTCIVITELGGEDEQQVVGIVVDTVSEVLEIPATEIEPPPAFGARIRTDFIRGMGKVKGGFVILLDLTAVLATEELARLSEMAQYLGASPASAAAALAVSPADPA
ncbi:MAG TPA: chemotaxis protein CheW [Thiobacillaceae bacterium]|nr:chemotaxis protein CheW [Burkholderiaceae bacterium]HNB47145.1 chemotaxis protein CheW [Burkholderiaceae bacterium]HNF90254.1 chemotaxis protein CheW [Thiobacillaceae bacterium]